MIKEILNSEIEIKKNIDIIKQDYKNKTGRVVCLSCPSDIQYMILTLKNIYKMVNFRLKKENAQYKNKASDRITISNNTMSDLKAIEFLSTNTERIDLFSVYPENWKDLIAGAKTEAGAGKSGCEGNRKKLPTLECLEKKRKELEGLKLKDLRKSYPNIKENSIKDFAEAILLNDLQKGYPNVKKKTSLEFVEFLNLE